MISGTESDQTLFSIDVEAHLQKAATHTFGNAAHYPVELVRAALRRGAKRVHVQISSGKIEVWDDGEGLQGQAQQILTWLLTPDTPITDRELAVEALQTREGHGLLAIFAAEPTAFTLETHSARTGQSLSLDYRGGQLMVKDDCSLAVGTRITLLGRHRNRQDEVQLLEVFCQGVPASIELLVNQRRVGGAPHLTRQLAIMDVNPSEVCGAGQIGIPRTGSLCCLRLLDPGIPWHHFTLPSQQGFVFEAAIEYIGDADKITMALVQHLLSSVEHLYTWLCQRYAYSPPHLQQRVEELVFKHCQQSGNLSFLYLFEPFPLHFGTGKVGYRVLKARAARGPIYAVPQKKERLLYHTRLVPADVILSLSREQADLLINRLALPIIFLSPIKKKYFMIGPLFFYLKNFMRKVWSWCGPVPEKIVVGDALSSEEAFFLRTLNHALAERKGIGDREEGEKRAVMVDSRGPFPVVLVGVRGGPAIRGVAHRRGDRVYLVRRHHPQVRAGVAAVRRDRENIDLFVALLENCPS